MGKISHNETSKQNATTSIFTLGKDIKDTGGLHKSALLCGVTDTRVTGAHTVWYVSGCYYVV